MNRLISIIALTSVASVSQAQSSISSREMSSRVAHSGAIVTTSCETVDGIDVFGTSFKTVSKNGRIVHNGQVVARRPAMQAPQHNQDFSTTAFEVSTGIAASDVVYSNAVYFEQDGELKAATHVQTFDGKHTHTLVVEQGTYNVLLEIDETVACMHQPDPADALSDDFNNSIPSVRFRRWADDNPFPGTPHPTGVPDQWQAPFVSHDTITNPRNLASPRGWIFAPGGYLTGNNVRAETYGVNNQHIPNGPVFASNAYTNPIQFEHYYRLDYDWTSADFQTLKTAATNAFVVGNLYHDWIWGYGFREGDGNFQENNYNRGGVGGDSILAYTEYNSVGYINNAFFSGTHIDGTPATVILWPFRYSLNGPDRHSGFDNQLCVHEYQHGTTRRLVGDMRYEWIQVAGVSECMSDLVSLVYNNMDRGELYREDVIGFGGWLAYKLGGSLSFEDNYYFGIRPYPINVDLNPMTLRYTDFNGGWEFPDDEYPRTPRIINYSGHYVGQVPLIALWEVYHEFIEDYGFEDGTNRFMFLVVDAMRVMNPNPSLEDLRDAFVLADELLSEGEHRTRIWAAFARRGMGEGFTIDERIASPLIRGVTESHDSPNWADYNRDGIRDAGDIHAFITDFHLGSMRADLNLDNTLNIQDVLDWLELWND